jgi:hypothetical protein
MASQPSKRSAVSSRIDLLADCLRGRAPPEHLWRPVLDLANRGLVTARLAQALEGAPEVPDPVAAFLAEVLDRNRRRNQALCGQLAEAVGVLNAAGVEPVLLKGAAGLVGRGPAWRDGRILCDLDILVRPGETDAALGALIAAGYGVFRRRPGQAPHAVAELARAGDRASIDLHQRPPGPPGMAEITDLREHASAVEAGGARALVPDRASQLYLLVLHDQFHDGDYWSGRLNLRHLLDIGDLIEDGPLDWARLESLVGTAVVRHALDTELIDAAWLTGARIPHGLTGGLWPRVQHRRRLIQVAWPALMLPLAAVTTLYEAPSLVAHRREILSGRRRLFVDPSPPGALGSLVDRLVRFKDIFLTPVTGKL